MHGKHSKSIKLKHSIKYFDAKVFNFMVFVFVEWCWKGRKQTKREKVVEKYQQQQQWQQWQPHQRKHVCLLKMPSARIIIHLTMLTSDGKTCNMFFYFLPILRLLWFKFESRTRIINTWSVMFFFFGPVIAFILNVYNLLAGSSCSLAYVQLCISVYSLKNIRMKIFTIFC